MFYLVSGDPLISAYYAEEAAKANELFYSLDERWALPKACDLSKISPVNDQRLTIIGQANLVAFEAYSPRQFCQFLLEKRLSGELPKTITTIDIVACDIGLSIGTDPSWIEALSALMAASPELKDIKLNAISHHIEADEDSDSRLIVRPCSPNGDFIYSVYLLTHDEQVKLASIDAQIYDLDGRRLQIKELEENILSFKYVLCLESTRYSQELAIVAEIDRIEAVISALKGGVNISTCLYELRVERERVLADQDGKFLAVNARSIKSTRDLVDAYLSLDLVKAKLSVATVTPVHFFKAGSPSPSSSAPEGKEAKEDESTVVHAGAGGAIFVTPNQK